MTKVTLDMETFKALASDTRLDILRTLDGKKMSLKDISKTTRLNKATLHEHLSKLNEAGLVKKKEREGHKWIYYKLTWKGESLLHPENTRIVVLFTTTFVALWVGIIQLIWYVKGTAMNLGYNVFTLGEEVVMAKSAEVSDFFYNGNTTLSPNSPGILGDSGLLENLMNMKSYAAEHSSIPLGQNLTFVETLDVDGSIPTGLGGESTRLIVDESQGILQAIYQNPMFLYIAVGCFIVFSIVLCISLWRLWENKIPKL